MISGRTRKTLLLVIGGGAVLAGLAIGAVLWDIHRSVEHWRGVAQALHPNPDDDVAALIAFVASDAHSLRERNSAVWTLGRLGDPRALPVLEAACADTDCDHEHRLCQRELGKAIERCAQGAS